MRLADGILAALARTPQMTSRDLACELDTRINSIGGKLDLLKKKGWVHVSGYRRDDDGGRLYVRALWSAGPGDGKKPRKPRPLGDSEYSRRYRERLRIKVPSVWAMGEPVAARRFGEAAR